MIKELGYLVYGIYVVLTAWLLLNGILQLHLWRLAKKTGQKQPDDLSGLLPFVSIQAPVYNEKYVVEGLLVSLCNLDYPKELFEILVLDDSTDETSILIDTKVATLAAAGFQIRTIRRRRRTGYKAGALQESLSLCRGHFIAIFDADFRPQPTFLTDLLPSFSDPNVGLVQARWGHLNREQNFLTRVQAFLLDTYFSVEQAGRSNGGYFTNFCGTAGIWRKECIVDAGGWDGTVLSEDLDLSYRAQLKEWKIVFREDKQIPAELPAVAWAFKMQQFRWTKGIMQVFRKNSGDVWKASLPFSKKLHAFFHLSGSFVFPCLLVNSLLSLPLLLFRYRFPEFVALTNISAIGGLNLLFLTWIFSYGTKNGTSNAQFSRYYPIFLLVYMGLSVQNTVAVLQGMVGKPSAFLRTPKFHQNKAAVSAYLPQKWDVVNWLEVFFLLYFIAGILLSFYVGDYFFLLLFVMMATGLAILVFHAPWQRKKPLRILLPKISWRAFISG